MQKEERIDQIIKESRKLEMKLAMVEDMEEQYQTEDIWDEFEELEQELENLNKEYETLIS